MALTNRRTKMNKLIAAALATTALTTMALADGHSINEFRIGILGGTFDPPHLGHVHISKVALKKLSLDKLIWIVTKKNPLKNKPFLSQKKRIKLKTLKISNIKTQLKMPLHQLIYKKTILF